MRPPRLASFTWRMGIGSPLGGPGEESRERAEWVGMRGVSLVQVSKGDPSPTTSTRALHRHPWELEKRQLPPPPLTCQRLR